MTNKITDMQSRLNAIKQDLDSYERQTLKLRTEWHTLRDEMSALIAREVYGLMVGDVIFVTRESYRGTKSFTIKISSFSADSARDKHPVIYGVVVLKSGKLGVKREYCYPSLEGYTWKKVSEVG